jgi:hypothetical protein
MKYFMTRPAAPMQVIVTARTRESSFDLAIGEVQYENPLDTPEVQAG